MKTFSSVRVCIVTESFLPQINGVTNSVLRLLEYLKGNGHKVLVVAPSNSVDEYLGFPIVKMPSVHLKRFGDIRVALPINRVIDQIFDFQPDVIHLASPALMGYLVAKRANLRNVPSIGVFQTDLAGFAEHYGLGLSKNAIWNWVSRIHRIVDRTLAPSSQSCKDLESLSVTNVYLWKRGVDIELFTPEKRIYEVMNTGKRRVGYVGRLANEKRLSDLTAISKRTDIELIVVGDGPARAELEQILPEANFKGFLKGEELARIYANLDCFIHTGPNETFCQSVQEALASGIPTIAVDKGGPKDLIINGINGFLTDTSDGSKLNNALDRILHPSCWQNFSIAARESVVNRSWNVIMDELMIHYKSVISNRKSIQEVIA